MGLKVGESHIGGNHVRREEKCPPVTRLIVSIALAAITGLVAYYCISYGLTRLDMAMSRWDTFVGGTMAYMGAAFSLSVALNLGWGTLNVACLEEQGGNYSTDEATKQIAMSLFAPIVAIPAAVCVGVMGVTRR